MVSGDTQAIDSAGLPFSFTYQIKSYFDCKKITFQLGELRGCL